MSRNAKVKISPAPLASEPAQKLTAYDELIRRRLELAVYADEVMNPIVWADIGLNRRDTPLQIQTANKFVTELVNTGEIDDVEYLKQLSIDFGTALLEARAREGIVSGAETQAAINEQDVHAFDSRIADIVARGGEKMLAIIRDGEAASPAPAASSTVGARPAGQVVQMQIAAADHARSDRPSVRGAILEVASENHNALLRLRLFADLIDDELQNAGASEEIERVFALMHAIRGEISTLKATTEKAYAAGRAIEVQS